MPEVGEEIVGSWLLNIALCDFIRYNVSIGSGSDGEIDVMGIDLKNSVMYVCEVASHIHGLGYANNKTKIVEKFRRAKGYMRTLYQDYAPKRTRYMFWAPVVGGPKCWEELHGVVTVLKEEQGIDLELFVEKDYLKELRQLRVKAGPPLERNATDPILRLLQLEERAKRPGKKASGSN